MYPERNRLVAPLRFLIQVMTWTSGLACILAEGAIELSVTLSGGALFAN